jgi:GGDEF domain-containing protein
MYFLKNQHARFSGDFGTILNAFFFGLAAAITIVSWFLAILNDQVGRSASFFWLSSDVLIVTGALCLAGLFNCLFQSRKNSKNEDANWFLRSTDAFNSGARHRIIRHELGLEAALPIYLEAFREHGIGLSLFIVRIEAYDDIRSAFGKAFTDEIDEALLILLSNIAHAHDCVMDCGEGEYAIIAAPRTSGQVESLKDGLPEAAANLVFLKDGQVVQPRLAVGVAKSNKRKSAKTLCNEAFADMLRARCPAE